MRSEIGSEFWDIPVSKENNCLFPKDTVWFLSGRSALRKIIQDIKSRSTVSTAAIPSWCCDSMIAPFLAEGIKVRFYSVFYENGMLRQNLRHDCDLTLVMDFFGYESGVEASCGIVIRDLTHGIISNRHHDADYCFGSLRKWCGVPTGGFAWRTDGVPLPRAARQDSTYASLRQTAMAEKALYLSGGSDSKRYLSVFAEAEARLESCQPLAADPKDILSVQKLNVDFLKERRRNNAKILLDALSEYAVFPVLGENDVPLFVPILTEKRDTLRKFLIAHEVYCPVHWPLTALHSVDEREKRLYHEEISLICDQRYDAIDMERIIDLVKRGLSIC